MKYINNLQNLPLNFVQILVRNMKNIENRMNSLNFLTKDNRQKLQT